MAEGIHNKMHLSDIRGVKVNFPFTPYECQVDYMTKVIECLQNNQNGVLESPTGTGKTLSLLCAALAWQESRKAQVELNKQAGVAAMMEGRNDSLSQLVSGLSTASGASWGSDDFFVPKIVYASRTHSQLSQAVQELKRTAYNSVKSSVIGSREQLCIHPQVQKLTSNAAKVQMCRSKVASRQCHFYNNIEDFKKKNDSRVAVGNVVDIEDIVKVGQKMRTCPYYMARELKADSDIVFLPYNYLLDSKSRKTHGVELQGSVIIFDEAHNLEKICEESASFDLSSLDLATAIEETTKLAEKVTEMSSSSQSLELSQAEESALMPEFTLEDIIRLKKTLLDVENNLDEVEISLSKSGRTLPGSYIFEFLGKVNINWTTKYDLIDKLDKMVTFLANDDGNAILNTKGAGLSKFADCLKVVFSQEPADGQLLYSHQQSLSQHFKVHIQIDKTDSKGKNKIDAWSTSGATEKKGRTLSYWCFSPGHTMKDLVAHGVKVIILTSGTLAPLDSFTKEMQIPFPVQLENPHVINSNQVWLGTVCQGPDGAALLSDYKNRSTTEYKKSLGNTITNFVRVVPNGLLVFFPSYPVMDQCIEFWQSSNQWNIITQYKPVVVEPKGKTAFNDAIDEFYSKMDDPTLNGAIFMAVCRGKVSEGLDFADANGRAVMITGLPFPPRFEARIQLKMDFLQENKAKFNGLDGNTWYRQQATRAVNQAIGRVIRHNKDYGAIILCDKRFSSNESKNSLPVWVRGRSQVYPNFGLAVRDVIKFFKEAEKNYPCAAPDQRRGKGTKSEEGIVTGAYFEPSFSKRSLERSHVSIQFEKASQVACHVPSLKEGEEHSVYSQYSKKKMINSSRKRSLLEALDSSSEASQNEQKSVCSSDSQADWLNSPEEPLLKPPTIKKLPGKQKRIKIKVSEKVSNSDQPGSCLGSSFQQEYSCQSSSKQRSQKALVSSQDFVSEVKASLTKEEYVQFSQTLKGYRTDNILERALPVLTSLFTLSPSRHHLLQKFFRFVRPTHRALYAQRCLELTGLTCCDSKDKTSNTDEQKGHFSGSSVTTTTTTISSSNITMSSGSGAEADYTRLKELNGPHKAQSEFTTQCYVCKKLCQKLLQHHCGVVACLPCWMTSVFKKSTERRCLRPDCQGLVQRKHLKYLNMADITSS